MAQLLARYGLGELAPWLSQQITSGATLEEIELNLYDQPAFIKRFPAIRQRGRDGKPPLSVEEYLQYERQMFDAANSFGVTVSYDEINDLLIGDVSFNEAQDRLALAGQAVHAIPQETKNTLQQFYGVTSGDLTKYWLDPKKELPVLQRRFAAATIGGQAVRTGFGDITAEQAEGLAVRGVENATDAFGKLVQSRELFEAVDQTEQDITVDDQLKLITGDAELTGQVEKRAQKRVAPFQSGGGFGSGNKGLSGLGSANT